MLNPFIKYIYARLQLFVYVPRPLKSFILSD